jgi:hypothetical protein
MVHEHFHSPDKVPPRDSMYSRVLRKASLHLFSMETVEFPFVFFFATPDFEVVGDFELTFFFFFFFSLCSFRGFFACTAGDLGGTFFLLIAQLAHTHSPFETFSKP